MAAMIVPTIPPGVELLDGIDPAEVRTALRRLRKLRGALKSPALRDDVAVALDRIARIRFAPRPSPTSRSFSSAA